MNIPSSALHGRGGKLYSWYGIGQSLLMLPADHHGHLACPLADLCRLRRRSCRPQHCRQLHTNILVNVLTALIAFRFLRQLRFSAKESVAGVLALLFCTTHLHYTQNMMENNYIMLLTLTGFSFQYEWLRTGSRARAFHGLAALGPEPADPSDHWPRSDRRREFFSSRPLVRESGRPRLWRRFPDLHKDRRSRLCILFDARSLYQFYRFGSFTNTYVATIRPGTPPAGSDAARELSLEYALSRWFSRRAVPAGEVHLSLRSASRAGDFSRGIAWKRLTPELRAYGVTSLSRLLGLYQLLRAIHVSGRRFRLGRPLCFDRGRTGDACRGAAADALSRESEPAGSGATGSR